MYVRWVPGEVKQSREDQITVHALALEFEDGSSTGGTVTTDMMQSLWDAHSSEASDKTQVDV